MRHVLRGTQALIRDLPSFLRQEMLLLDHLLCLNENSLRLKHHLPYHRDETELGQGKIQMDTNY